MAMLVLKFDNKILKELPLGERPVRIGRAPDNDIHIDNLGVSDYHARVFTESERLIVEDLGSLNGTFLNNNRIKREWLRSADAILIGKHVIVVDLHHDADPTLGVGRRMVAPKLEETVIMGTKGRSELLQQGASAGEGPKSDRARVPSLVVMKGNTQQKDYVLSGKLTVIGKSSMATVRLKGWFAPQVAAQINKRPDGYYLGLGKRIPKINGIPTKPPVRLKDGDVIEVAGVVLKFMYRD